MGRCYHTKCQFATCGATSPTTSLCRPGRPSSSQWDEVAVQTAQAQPDCRTVISGNLLRQSAMTTLTFKTYQAQDSISDRAACKRMSASSGARAHSVTCLRTWWATARASPGRCREDSRCRSGLRREARGIPPGRPSPLPPHRWQQRPRRCRPPCSPRRRLPEACGPAGGQMATQHLTGPLRQLPASWTGVQPP